MNVLYCCDDRAYSGLAASVYSLLTHNKNVNIYVFSMDYERAPDINGMVQCYLNISPEHQHELKKIVQYLDPKHSNIKFVDMKQYYEDLFVNGCNENDGHSSPYATLKLCFDKVCLNIDDILYLDCDTIVQKDLHPMYHRYLNELRSSNYCYAGYYIPFDEPQGEKAKELVAGVLLFDLVKCRKHQFFERVRYNVTHRFYMWYEQSAIEDTEKGVEMDETYNYMEKYEERDYDPAILHFANNLNPKIYFSTEKIFYNKYPHLKYIQNGINLVRSLNLQYK